MWTSMKSLTRTALPYCSLCGHKIQTISSSHNETKKMFQSTFLPNLMRLENLGDHRKISKKRILFSLQSKQPLSSIIHMTGNDYLDCYNTALSTDAHDAKNSYCHWKKMVAFYKRHNIKHLAQRMCLRPTSESCAFKTLKAAEPIYTERLCPFTSSSSQWSFYGSSSKRNIGRHSGHTEFKSDTKSQGPFKCIWVNHSNPAFRNRYVGLWLVDDMVFHKKGKIGCYYSRTNTVHTSVERKNIQSGGQVRKQPPWRILFFGTDEIAVHTLKDLHQNMISSASLVESLEVVTVEGQRPVRTFAEREQIKIHEWPIPIQNEKYDVGVLVSFGHLIPDAVIHMFPYGILNMHPSLLPRWRGASPIIHAILYGDDVTGVSVMEIRPKRFDIGPVLLQRKCPVPYRCTSFQLSSILGPFGANMMLECLKDLPKLERFEHEQGTEGVTYAHKLKKKNAYINWENSTPEQIDCQYRAISELIPLRTELDGIPVKLLDVVDPSLLKDVKKRDIRGYQGDISNAKPGTVAYNKLQKCLIVCCKEGVIGFRKLVFHKPLTASDFCNGYLNKRPHTQFTSFENDINKYIYMARIPKKART